jgi:5-methylthioribose kinase
MFEITPENAADFLRDRGWIGPGPVEVAPLGGGVSNLVLCVTTAERKLVLKQSRPQLRTRDAWFSDLDRAWREMEVMQALGPLLPPLTVPEVLFSDRENYAFVIGHAPEPFRVWKEALLAGDVVEGMGQRAGQVLARMHQASAGNNELRERFANLRVYEQLRIEPFYRTVQRRVPEVARAIEPIVERMYFVKEGICHGDYTPKNMLVHAQGFTLVDYETAHYGDPTMDVGLFLAHLVLKAFRRPVHAYLYLPEVLAFLDAYLGEDRLWAEDERIGWGIEHLAVCLLARIDGTSPVDYLPEELKREAVRGLAGRILHDRPRRWADVFRRIEKAVVKLAALEDPRRRYDPDRFSRD